MEEWRGNGWMESWSWHMYRFKMNWNLNLRKIITMIFRWIPFSIIINSLKHDNNSTNNMILYRISQIILQNMWWTKQIKLFIKWNAVLPLECSMMISFVTESNEKFAWNVMLKASGSLSNLAIIDLMILCPKLFELFAMLRIHRTPYISYIVHCPLPIHHHMPKI